MELYTTRTAEVKEAEEKFYRQFQQEDKWTSWLFFQPHTIAAFLLGGGILLYFAFSRDDNVGIVSNTKFGLVAVCIVYLFLSGLQMRDGLLVRPHPVLWRLAVGASVIYLCLLVFVLFQTADDARFLLQVLDPSLGKPLPEKSYAEHCEIYTPEDPISSFRNVRDTFYDEFAVAHLLGWFGKAIMMRDATLCWITSIGFEILELSLQHLLPNFAECWWDHIIIDVFMCNWLGIYLGLKVVNYFSIRPYNLFTKYGGPSVEAYSWEIFSSWKRLAAALFLVIVFSVVELNAFFLKFVLWIPPPHPVNVSRLVLWWVIGQPGIREYYQWVTDKKCKKFGTMSWMCAAICVLEILLTIKFGRGMFPNPHPPVVVWSWTIAILAFLGWAVWFYSKKPAGNEAVEGKAKEKDT